MRRALLCVVCTLLPAWAHSAEREPTHVPVGSALQRSRGFSVGVFDPLRVALTPQLELVTHPLLWFALSPNARVRSAWLRSERFVLSGEYGLSLPTQALRFTKGFLFPSWERSQHNIGWLLAPSAGVRGSWLHPRFVLTGEFDVTLGVPLGRNDATPLDSYAPLELLTAPVTSKLRQHLGVQLDVPLHARVRLRFGIDSYLLGKGPGAYRVRSPWLHSAKIAVDFLPSRALRLSLGLTGYDYDQRKSRVRTGDDGFAVREPVRSRELWPSFDVVFQR